MILQLVLGRPNVDNVHMDMLPVVTEVPDDLDLSTLKKKVDFEHKFVELFETSKNEDYKILIDLLSKSEVILLDVYKVESIFKIKEERQDEKIQSKSKKRR